MPARFKSQGRGFTLIELMIVATIIGILAAMAIPQGQIYREKAQIARAISTGHQMLNALVAYTVTSPGNRFPAETGEFSVYPYPLIVYVAPHAILIATICDLFDKPALATSDVALGPENITILIPIQGIKRPEGEELVMEVSSIEGAKIHTACLKWLAKKNSSSLRSEGSSALEIHILFLQPSLPTGI